MAEPMTREQFDAITDRWADVPMGETAQVSVTGSSRPGLLLNALTHAVVDVPALVAEVERRLTPEDVERFLKRERDEYEPRGECWNTVDDVLDCFRLHMVTGTPLTEPRPVEGPEPYGVGDQPMTEAEELRAEVERLRAELDGVRADERRRCVEELRSHSKTRMDLAVAEVAAGNDGALVSVSFAATLDKASRLLESGELSVPSGEDTARVPAPQGSPS
ncbi:hypothetical protein IMZ11_02695 [Microtetraspora sp. AC03309]|uniref:hypothetical protein n=1 Tax=Microtetraspora sp. AC03309 TaxID=2779376 RepID=UPI001E55EBE1|nr:hypothetical protein [Microtetraspora sp. AC03309]MCC5574548.1 hypothetical protein [Microtetraspora sp. AC03309]